MLSFIYSVNTGSLEAILIRNLFSLLDCILMIATTRMQHALTRTNLLPVLASLATAGLGILMHQLHACRNARLVYLVHV